MLSKAKQLGFKVHNGGGYYGFADLGAAGSNGGAEGGKTYYIYLFIMDDWFATHSVTVTDRRPAGFPGGDSWIDRAVARWWQLGWNLQDTTWGRVIYMIGFPLSLPVSLALLGLQWIITGRNTHSIR